MVQRISNLALDIAAGRSTASPREQGGADFGDAVKEAIGAVETKQIEADTEAHKVALGHGNLHEAALSLEKADISMRLLVKTRNKLVEAYQEIMRMPI